MKYLSWFMITVLVIICSSAQAQYFIDDFEDGNAEDGDPVTWVPLPSYDAGTREVTEGSYVITPGYIPIIINDYYEDDSIVDGVVFSNVSIQTQVQALDPGNPYRYWLGVFARSTDTSGISAYIRRDGLLVIRAFDELSGSDDKWTVTSLLDPIQTDVHLQLDIFDSSAQLFAWLEGCSKPDTPQLNVYLPSYIAGEGELGIFVGNMAYNTSIRVSGAYRWFTAAPTTLDADFDLDADVDGNDFLAWQKGFDIQGGATPADGDSNGDGNVASDDLVIWQQEFGATADSLCNAAIPEPASIVLLLIVTSLVFACGQKRRNACY